jgi:hypothetical protein
MRRSNTAMKKQAPCCQEAGSLGSGRPGLLTGEVIPVHDVRPTIIGVMAKELQGRFKR